MKCLEGTSNILSIYLDDVIDDLEHIKYLEDLGLDLDGDIITAYCHTLLKAMVTGQKTKNPLSIQELTEKQISTRVSIDPLVTNALLRYLQDKKNNPKNFR